TTLIRDLLLPALAEKLKHQLPGIKASDRLATDEDKDQDEDSTQESAAPAVQVSGWQSLDAVMLVDQSILAKTPRSNPAVYSGAFDHIRSLFAESDLAKRRGLNASAFSFNSAQGQCERCRGAGFEKIEMQFLSDVFVRCPECNGRRYRSHILEIKLSPASPTASAINPSSIADILDQTVEEAMAFLVGFPESTSARRALHSLAWLQEVGLGYLKLGQPINTLSGGESQRLKLVRHLADLAALKPGAASSKRDRAVASAPRILFLFDEPTTGLHFEDIRILLKAFQRLVDAGHSVLVIEHNLDVIKSADWIVDLGPDAGDQGGQIVATGTPEDVANCPRSHTGVALRQVITAAPS
ncbi:MAG TPA: hypothetical protein VN673_12535, partial [Clostridia bacterium]|nr:hypothetical protein [Clostridia bacterium]